MLILRKELHLMLSPVFTKITNMYGVEADEIIRFYLYSDMKQ